MCGRFALAADPDEVRVLFGYSGEPWLPPRYNIAPTQPVAVVRRRRDGHELALMRWGLVPAWVKDPREFPLLINARAETLSERPAYRAALSYGRCLVPASGFYEWQLTASGRRQPFWLAPAAGGAIAFAGLYETWLGADGSEFDSLAIITTGATGVAAAVHDRMPLIVSPEDFGPWLDGNPQSRTDLKRLLLQGPEDAFRATAVSPLVNSAGNDGPELIRPCRPAELPDAPLPGRRQLDLF